MSYDNDELKRLTLEWVLADWPGGDETYIDGLTPELFDQLMAGDTPDEVRVVDMFTDWYLPALLEQFYRFGDSVYRQIAHPIDKEQPPEPVVDPDVATLPVTLHRPEGKMRLLLRANLSIGTMTNGCGALVDRSLWERMSEPERDELALDLMRDMLDVADWSYVAVPDELEG